MFDPSDDLASVADGIETVTLRRRGSALDDAGEVIPHALRRAISAAEATIMARGDVHKAVASSGMHRAAVAAWHLPISELPVSPQLGDVLLDSDGQRWTILAVKQTTLGTRWRCETKNVAVVFGLDDTVSVLKSDGSGLGAAWRVWRTGIRARIQPIDTNIKTTEDAQTTTRRYRVFVEENWDVDHTCCIRGPDGVLYTITGCTGADRIGELQVIEVQIVSTSSIS